MFDWRRGRVYLRCLPVTFALCPGRIYFFFVITIVWRTCRGIFLSFSLSLSFFLLFSSLSDTNKRITEKERHVEYYACVHVVKKQNRKEVFLTLAWIVTRGCYHGNADSTTVEGRYLPHLVFQGKGMPYLPPWHTNCDPCLLFPFSIVYSRHNACRYMYVTIKIENLESYTLTGQRTYLRNVPDST